jgi:hypothetical protein
VPKTTPKWSFCAWQARPRLTKKTFVTLSLHICLPNGFSMSTCPHKQDILKEKDNKKKTHIMFHAHHQDQQPLLLCACIWLRSTIAYLPTQMRCTIRKPMTFVAHDQDQPSIRSNITYLPTKQSGDTPPKVLRAYNFSPRIRQRCLKLAYMPKMAIKVFHST